MRAAGLVLKQPMMSPSVAVSNTQGAHEQAELDTPSAAGSFRSAFLMHGMNVKALLFFAMLVPQFIHADQSLANQVTLLLALHLTVAVSVLFGYAKLGTFISASSHVKKLTIVLDLAASAVMGALSIGILSTIDGNALLRAAQFNGL